MPARTSPPEQFAEICQFLIEQLDGVIVLTGSAGEGALIEHIESLIPAPARRAVVAAAGTHSFEEFGALIKAADLVVTNNTGPMHMAAAVKTPVIALFALTNPPEQWGPWQVPHRLLYHDVPCRLCYSRVCPHNQECVRLVTPEETVRAVIDLLAGSRKIHSKRRSDLAMSFPIRSTVAVSRS